MREMPKIYCIYRQNASQNNVNLNTLEYAFFAEVENVFLKLDCIDDTMIVQSAEVRMCNSRNALEYSYKFTLHHTLTLNYLYFLLQLQRSNFYCIRDKCLTKYAKGMITKN